MKNLRDSANIVRSMARQYQAVIDLAEHVGEGDKLEAAHADAEKRLKVEERRIENAKAQHENAQKELADLKGRIESQREALKEVEGKTLEARNDWNAHVKEAAQAANDLAGSQAQADRKLDAAQKQILTLQGTINEKKDELSRLQDKIARVQEAIAKVA